MLQVAYIHTERTEQRVVEKKLTKKEVDYLDSFNWVKRQRAIDTKEANTFFEAALNELENKKPRL